MATTEDISEKRAPSDDADLRWLFWESEAALGFRSGFGSVIERGRVGTVIRYGADTDGKMTGNDRVVSWLNREGAIGRERRLLGYLAQISPRHVEILWRAYGPHAVHAQVTQVLGVWAPVVLLTRAATKGYEAANAKREEWDPGKRGVFKTDAPVGIDGGAIRAWMANPQPPEPPSLGVWLRAGAPKSVIRAARIEAGRLVAEAHAAWATVAGRKARNANRIRSVDLGAAFMSGKGDE